jgi:DNA-binding response OmpR family regulator
MRKRILVVEDDAALARVLTDNLVLDGFTVDCASDAQRAIERVQHAAPDLVILDVMLPDGNGFDLCAHIRQGSRTPIIMLTARSQKADKLLGLSLGADDYVTKPFDLQELLARIQAVLRRTRPSIDRLRLGRVLIDFTRMRAWRGTEEIHLTHREFELLHYLAERPGQVVSRSELLSRIWTYAEAPITRLVDHAMGRLRKKLETDPHRPLFLHTAHGYGYCLMPEGGADIDRA